ncbi:hypothetical protein ACFLZV_05790 [Candidatus Margulisiibacteriota bacterium]
MDEQYKFLDFKRQAAERDIEILETTAKKRIVSYLLFTILWPYLVFLRILLAISSLFSRQTWALNASRFLRHYFKIYFKFKGINPVMTTDIPFKKKKPMIIFTIRRDDTLPVFFYKLFPYPIIIPLVKKFRSTNAIHFFPFRMKKLFETISYPDINLGQNLKNIQEMLAEGYSVLVHINQHYLDPISMRTITFYKAFESLLQEDADIYFMHARESRQLKFAALLSPVLITIDITKKEELLNEIDQNDQKCVLDRIATFFGFLRHECVE